MKKICVCVPTYNRPEAITEVMQTELEFLRKHSIDLLIYDSSTNQETERLVNQSVAAYENLYYKRVDSQIISNQKVFMIYEELQNSVYDYVWIIHDHTVFDEAAIRHIIQALETDADFYLLKMQSSGFGAEMIYTLDEFLLEGAWILNSFGTAIVKRGTMLRGSDWGDLKKKYMTKKTYNYSHIGFYYERISQLENPVLCRLEFPRECFFDFMRYQRPSWDKESIRICLECWGETISSLPEEYSNKKLVLQTQDKWFLSRQSLIEHKRCGRYRLVDFLRYRKWIKLIMPENYVSSFWIAALPYRMVFRIYCLHFLDEIRKQQKSGRKICLYGAGRHAFECFTYLKDNQIEIDGYLVSKQAGNPSEIMGYQVYQAKRYLEENKAFVIIAVLTSGAGEIQKYLQELEAEGIDTKYVTFNL